MIIEIITMILQIVKTYTLLYKMYQRKSLSLSPPPFLSLSHLSPVTLAISLSTSLSPPLSLSLFISYSQTAVYANISDLYQDSFTEEDSFGYGDEKIYDSVLRYQAKVSQADHIPQLYMFTCLHVMVMYYSH